MLDDEALQHRIRIHQLHLRPLCPGVCVSLPPARWQGWEHLWPFPGRALTDLSNSRPAPLGFPVLGLPRRRCPRHALEARPGASRGQPILSRPPSLVLWVPWAATPELLSRAPHHLQRPAPLLDGCPWQISHLPNLRLSRRGDIQGAAARGQGAGAAEEAGAMRPNAKLHPVHACSAPAKASKNRERTKPRSCFQDLLKVLWTCALLGPASRSSSYRNA